MPSKSKSQQRFMGMVRKAQEGGKVPKRVAKAARRISATDAHDFASTKLKGLPNKVSPKE